jgi:hypothetical protein
MCTAHDFKSASRDLRKGKNLKPIATFGFSSTFLPRKSAVSSKMPCSAKVAVIGTLALIGCSESASSESKVILVES